MKKNINFSANGKLLLTGEYLVLVGALALAFPVRFGQTMTIEPGYPGLIQLVSKENGDIWFSCDLTPVTLKVISCSDDQVANRFVDLLLSARKINPGFLADNQGYKIIVGSNYPLKWGLGSSSTLTSMIAGWAGVDKFALFRLVSKGSGYDLACTDRDSMLYYQLKNNLVTIETVQPGKALVNHACFVYLGKKQDSSSEVSAFLSGKRFASADVDRISELSHQICSAEDPSYLCSLVEEHDEILGGILKKERIKTRFPGFPGSVKSLGAWGGDFAMFVSRMTNREMKIWLGDFGFTDLFTYDELKVIR